MRARRDDLLDEQEGVTEKGGTMRLGAYPCALVAGTLAAEAYGEPLVQERHRHRYEFNSAYREELEAAGLVVSGTSPDGALVEMVELRRDRTLVRRHAGASRVQEPPHVLRTRCSVSCPARLRSKHATFSTRGQALIS